MFKNSHYFLERRSGTGEQFLIEGPNAWGGGAGKIQRCSLKRFSQIGTSQKNLIYSSKLQYCELKQVTVVVLKKLRNSLLQ